jgi:uncharacterized SAM-binding protein YcdF (DUF218 family)
MVYLSKLLPYLLYPITLILFLLVWAVVSRRQLPTILAMVILLITSSPIVSNQMLAYIDGQELKKSIEDFNKADSIVVLSGIITPIMTNQGIAYEWEDPDRFFGGVELIKAGKAKNIIFTGGIRPWQTKIKPEGQILAKIAAEFGIPISQIIVTKDVLNTLEEAKAVREILTQNNANKIILVTSAFHMPRASMIFQMEGIEVQTYSVDYKANISDITPIDFLPSAAAFHSFQISLRELIGRAYYSIIK